MDGSTKDLTSSERFESPTMSRAEPSRAEPSRAEPSRAEPSRAEPSRAEPSRAEPSRAEPSRAEPSRAEPSRAEPSRAEPSRAEPSRAEPSRGGRPSSKTYSAAGWPAGFARLGGARRGLLRSARALALPATAQAQSVTTLVSNIGQGSTLTRDAGVHHAQRFTTGSHGTGYTLSSVDVVYDDAEGDSFAAKVCTVDGDGHPTSTCTDLTAPASFAAGTITFTAPANTVLAPGTTYTVVLTRPSFGVAANTYGFTTADGEDAGQAAGWSIANTFEYWNENLEPDNWTTSASGRSLRIAIKGSQAPPPEVTLHLSDEDGSVLENAGWVTVTATVSPASPVPFTVTVSADPVAPATEDDFRLSSNLVLSFAANATESTGTVRIGPVDDDNPEPDDVVRVSGAVSNAAIQDPDDVTLTIVNEDAEAFDVAVSAPTAVDEDAGTATVTVTLTTRRNSAPVIDVELYYYWRQETATRGEDYRPPLGEVFTSNVLFATVPTSAFSPNAAGTAWEAERTFTIGIVDDQEAEADETIVFYVSTRAHASPEHTITLRDDDTPVMRNVTLVSGPGADGVWNAGERVELEVRYTLPVVVEQPEECWSYNADGTCKPPGLFVAVVFRSDARPGYGEGLEVALVPYVSGSGTATLRFAYTVGSAEAGARRVEVVDGKVLLRGATIRPLGGGDAELSEYTVTQVMQVTVRKPSGGAWTAGDTVRVNVRFTGPEAAASKRPPNRDKVEVNEAGGTPSIGLRLGDAETRTLARAAQYMGGSGSNTLRFEYEVTAGDGRVNAAEVVADSLARNGATIRNERGYDAELDHLGAVQYAQRPALSVADAEATEGEDATLDFVVRLDGNSGSDVTVDYGTRDGTATAGSDYTETSGTLTFEPGEDEKTVSVPIRDDAVHDDGETFTLLLSNVSGAGVANDDYEAVGTIREPPPTCPENADDVWCGVITVEDAAGTYEYNSFYDQGELSDNDFDVGTNSYTILIISVAGQRDKEDYGNLALQIDPRPNAEEKEELAELTLYLDNDAFKLSESRDGPSGFYYWVADLDWSSEGYILVRLGDASSGNSQRREESSPALSVADAEATEGEDETLDFLVRLDGNPGSDVTVDYGTRDGTATAGSDYTETSGTLTFEPGEDEQTVSVPITDDDVEDDGETFTLVLSNASGAGVANDDYEAVGTIRNDETEAPSGGLTASFEDMPETHDGESGFRFRVAFSEDIGISFRSLREDAFTVTGGRVTGGTRVDGRRDLFRMTVRPDSDAAVTITLPAGRECGVSGAICTKGEPRRPLTNSPSATVAGPVGIAVADARVEEGAGAVLAFAVTLSRAAV